MYVGNRSHVSQECYRDWSPHDMISKALDICRIRTLHKLYSPCLSGPILRMTLKIFDVYGPILALDKLSCEKCMGDMMSRHILGIYVGIHMYPKLILVMVLYNQSTGCQKMSRSKIACIFQGLKKYFFIAMQKKRSIIR